MNPQGLESAKPTDERGALTQMVLFSLAACELCVEIGQVREIIRLTEITRVPKAPDYLDGVINLRGRVIPVLDLKKKFKMPLVEVTDESRILVAELKAQILGLRVDKVSEVLWVGKGQIEKASTPILNIDPEHYVGFFGLNRRLVLLLNLEKLMFLDQMRVLPEIDGEPQGIGQKHGR